VIWVTGANGQLGTAFRAVLGSGAQYLDQEELDLTDGAAVAAQLRSDRPERVVNCAAYTAVDRAESDRSLAYSVNADAVEIMASVCAEIGARFVTFSTDYVFDGARSGPYVESDLPSPISVYGASKADGEMRALAADPNGLVIRTSLVLSGTHPNFAATMLRVAEGGGGRVVDDQVAHPTLVADLAPAVLEVVDRGVTGVLHLTNRGVVSRFELAREVLEIAGLDPDLIEPCSTEEYPTPARRPANSVLESERLEELALTPMPHYRPGLELAVASLTSRR
jgi:dTDP-4-dehydrorhamnose reductase